MFQAEPPTIVVATITSLCQMLEKQLFKLESMKVLVIDEVNLFYLLTFVFVKIVEYFDNFFFLLECFLNQLCT